LEFLLQQEYIVLVLLKMKQFLQIQLLLHQSLQYHQMKFLYLDFDQIVAGDFPKFIGDDPEFGENYLNFGKRKLNYQ
jgi:hypothetical protein